MSKNVKIIVSIACLALAIGVLYFTTDIFSGSGGGGGGGKTWMKCVNPDCNQAYSVTPQEFRQMQGENALDMMPMSQGPPVFKCLKCGQESAYIAQQCEKCKNVFINGEAGDETYPDRCPKCGYSYLEEAVKLQK
jgi:hypothetical protein